MAKQRFGILISRVILLFLFVCLCECTCPEDSTPEVIGCLRNITHGHTVTNVVDGSSSQINVLAGTGTETIQNYCRSGYFNKSVECLVHLYNVCSTSSEITSLQEIADPQTWRRGVNKLCDTLSLHAEYTECIVSQKGRVTQCLQQNEINFQRTITSKHSRKSIKHNLCRYFKGVEVCTAKPVEVTCGKDIGLVLADFIESLSPKFCIQHTNTALSVINHSLSSFMCLTVTLSLYASNTYKALDHVTS